MIAADLPEVIRERVCAEIRVGTLGDNFTVALPLTFGDGDVCRLFVKPEEDGTVTISDGGHVLALAFTEGVDLLSAGYADRFRSLAEFYGAKEDGRELRTKAPVAEIGDAVFSLTQACLELSRLTDLPPESARKQASFNRRFAHNVERVIPKELYEKRWHDPVRDPKGLYKIDYHVPGESIDWLISGAGSPAKCWRAAASIQHYRLTNLPLESVVAYSEATEKDPTAFEVLADNANHKFSLDKERDKFNAFLRSRVRRS